MGNQKSIPATMPLGCILSHWPHIDAETLKKKRLIFFCNTAWIQYQLGDQEQWPLNGTLNPNTLMQLDLFCKKLGKWGEIPYIQAFFYLKSREDLYRTCKLKSTPSLLSATLPALPLPQYPGPPKGKVSQSAPQGHQEQSPGHTDLLPKAPAKVLRLVEMAGGEFGTVLVHKPFSITELKQLKADLGSYTTNPDNYIDQVQHISLAYDFTWKDVMIILGQTLSEPEQERVIKEAH